MTTTPQYDRILETIDDQLIRDVYCQIRDHVGKEHAISLDALTITVYGQAALITDDDGNEYVNPTRTRAIREAIETLREVHGVPVCSNSGKAGRYLPASRAELDEFIAEHMSRADKLRTAAEKLRKAGATWDFEKPKHHIPASFEAVQSTLFDLPAAHREGAYV